MLDPLADGGPMPQVVVQVEQRGVWEDLRVGALLEDDGSGRIVTVAGPARDDSSQEEWCFYWIPPAGVAETARYRFGYAFAAGQWMHTRPFELDAPEG